MGFSIKSHSKRSDKETQSSMLKIIQDLIRIEKCDPEKTNLLKQKADKKKRQHSQKSKTNHSSSCSETSKAMRDVDNVKGIRIENKNTLIDEEKGEWCFRTEKEDLDKDDTFSCVSCALKKIAGSQYACVLCITAILLVTVFIAYLILFKSTPVFNSQPSRFYDSERLKRKIDYLKDKKGWRDDNFRKPKGDSKPSSYGGASESGFGSASFRGWNDLEGFASNSLSNILDEYKVSEIQNSERLKDFYRKLMETESQIQQLKKSNDINYNSLNGHNVERFKRSPKLFGFYNKHSKVKDSKDNAGIKKAKDTGQEKNENITVNSEVTKDKRLKNDSVTEPTVLENNRKEDYVPNRKVAKCSHTPKESDAHEKYNKHPFYQHTQKLEDILEQILGKNFEDVFSNQNVGALFEKHKDKCRHGKGKNMEDKHKTIKENTPNKLEMNTEDIKDEFTTANIDDLKTNDALNLRFDRNLIHNPIHTSKGNRRLLQVNDNENLEYPLLKDTSDGHVTNAEKSADRVKRDEDLQNRKIFHPLNVNNPNWKGPMPLYQDEINAMVKQAALNARQTVLTNNNVEVDAPLNTKEVRPKINDEERSLSDAEYIEDYFNDKYDSLVGVAQAYSDYGVLNSKKETIDKNGDKNLDPKVMLLDKGLLKRGLFGRLEKCTDHQPSEGIRIEFKPTSETRDDDPAEIYRLLHKHIHFSNEKDLKLPPHLTLPASDLGLMYTPIKFDKLDDMKKKDDNKIQEQEKGIIFTLSNGVRSLKSVDELNYSEPIGHTEEENGNGHDLITNFDINIKNEDALNYRTKPYLSENEKAAYVDLLKNDVRYKRELTNENVDLNNNTNAKSRLALNITNVTDLVNADVDFNAEKNNTVNTVNELFNSTAGMGLSDLFSMFSEFFSFMESMERKNNQSELNGSNLTIKATNDTDDKMKSDALYYPTYDADILENIGHRSRVLMSVNENNLTRNTEDAINKTIVRNENKLNVSDHNISRETEITLKNNDFKIPINGNRSTDDDMRLSPDKEKDNIRKRSINEGKMYWNEIYDDEYGVKDDLFENGVRDKHSIDVKNIVKSSKDWIDDKVRKIVSGFKVRKQENPIGTEDRDAKNSHENVGVKTTVKKHVKRELHKEEVNSYKPARKSFDELNANMKEVCRKAAKAVEESRNIHVRENTKEDAAATSLMQQLTRLMTDLVDYQVQQRTCQKLPPDLRNFLEWLTSPNKDAVNSDARRGFLNEDTLGLPINENPQETYPDFMMTSSSEKDQSEQRSDCLGTLRAVQDLINQYDGMTDEDKSKMSGVREYLESQVNFLQQRMSSYAISNVDSQNYLRYKRTIGMEPKQVKRLKKRNLSKFIRNFGKKHTKATTDCNEEAQVTDKAQRVNGKDVSKKLSDKKRRTKRNLRDIYYRALADAKKMTTVRKVPYDGEIGQVSQ
ncbi:uncharacterized protein LOC101742237 isoform X1 [Bombyx mori]|uniref:Uncharacterized protein n=2 Tax=Bombyx mori TaxID=7091 RepID=A0A8R1WPP8_BOMMO|nr:uncharacterized protein LOC101742237 isoform X1 [Bombyx mori]